MQKTKIILVILLVVVLQSSLATIWLPLRYGDLAMIVAVYFALQRDPVQAMVIGALAGLASDAFGNGLLGAGGFSKTLTAYFVSFLSLRVMLDNSLMRIPILAGATLVDAFVYSTLNRLLDNPSSQPLVETLAFKVLFTTTSGVLVLYLLELLFNPIARARLRGSPMRRTRRRWFGK
ncbi:MAG: rod shape-determining protein MreD [Pyrinomonadaceae bacterium]